MKLGHSGQRFRLRLRRGYSHVAIEHAPGVIDQVIDSQECIRLPDQSGDLGRATHSDFDAISKVEDLLSGQCLITEVTTAR